MFHLAFLRLPASYPSIPAPPLSSRCRGTRHGRLPFECSSDAFNPFSPTSSSVAGLVHFPLAKRNGQGWRMIDVPARLIHPRLVYNRCHSSATVIEGCLLFLKDDHQNDFLSKCFSRPFSSSLRGELTLSSVIDQTECFRWCNSQ